MPAGTARGHIRACFIGFILLAALPEAARAWQQDTGGIRTWQPGAVIEEPRPMRSLRILLEAKYGAPVTVEETILPPGAANRAGRSYPVKFYALNRDVRLVVPESLLPKAPATFQLTHLKQILDLYNRDGQDLMRFDAVSSEWGLHIVPVALRMEDGRVVEARSPLDAPVRVERKRRMASHHFKALCEAVRASAGPEIRPFGPGMDSLFAAGGLVPPKHATILLSEQGLEPYMFSWGAEGVTGREALISLLKQSSTTLSWSLLCRDVNGMYDGCTLNLHTLRDPELDAEGRPVLDEAGKPRLRYRLHDRLDKVPLKAPPIKIQ